MNIEDQVVSLNLARRLKELNLKQDSLLFHYNEPYEDGTADWVITNWRDYESTWDSKGEPYSAFSAAELMDILPAFIDTGMDEPFNNFYLEVSKRTAENIQYIAIYVCDSMPGEEINNPMYKIRSKLKSYDSKLADCLAKVLIETIEKGFFPDDKLQR